jgi:hypothetical protein
LGRGNRLRRGCRRGVRRRRAKRGRVLSALFDGLLDTAILDDRIEPFFELR